MDKCPHCGKELEGFAIYRKPIGVISDTLSDSVLTDGVNPLWDGAQIIKLTYNGQIYEGNCTDLDKENGV